MWNGERTKKVKEEDEGFPENHQIYFLYFICWLFESSTLSPPYLLPPWFFQPRKSYFIFIQHFIFDFVYYVCVCVYICLCYLLKRFTLLLFFHACPPSLKLHFHIPPSNPLQCLSILASISFYEFFIFLLLIFIIIIIIIIIVGWYEEI